MAAKRHALLVGINHYPKLANADLDGCVNDVELMRSLLVDRFDFAACRVGVLTDAEATRAGMIAALAELAERIDEDDVVVFFYAGHGSRMADPRQPGRMIESIVCSDSGRGQHPNRDLIDEEVDQWVQRVNAKSPWVTLVMDCCHSGSVTRDPFGDATREAPPDTRAPAAMFAGEPPPAIFGRSRDAGLEGCGRAGWVPGRRSALVLAACRAEELANEHRLFDGTQVRRHGAMTYFLGKVLLEAETGSTWRDVFERLAPKLQAAYERQHPQLEGKVDEVLFGTREIRPCSYLEVLSAAAATAELAGGAAHGVTPGSLWSIRSFGARNRDDGDEVAAVRVESIAAATCRVRAGGAAGAASIEPGQRAFLRELRLPRPGFRVAIAAPASQADERARLEALLAAEKLLEITGQAADADVLVRCLEPRDAVAAGDPCPGLGALPDRTWAAVGRDGRLAVRRRSEQGLAAADLDGLVRDLAGLARYRRLLELDNPDPASRLRGKVELRIRRRQAAPAGPSAEPVFVDSRPGPDGLLVLPEGGGLDVEIHNHHDRPLWITLVQFGTDGAIQLFMPYCRHSTFKKESGRIAVRLGPGEARSVREYFLGDDKLAPAVQEGLPLRLPQGFPWIAEAGERLDVGVMYLKLLVTPVDADFEFLEQKATRFTTTHPLQDLAFLYDSGKGERSLIPDPVGESPESDWATSTVAVGIRRE